MDFKVYFIHSNVVGFSSLSSRIQPKQLIDLIDHLQAVIDEAFADKDIFIMERASDGCIAASGLSEAICTDGQDRATSSLSMTDSSYGSEFELDVDKYTVSTRHKESANQQGLELLSPKPKPPSAVSYAATLAIAVLKLMSYSSRVKVPIPESEQLQLRIAMHSGPCSGGVVGLQPSSAGSSHIPNYKLFGETLSFLHNLCHSGLALQIRVSKQCRNLLLEEDEGFMFERSPDYMMLDSVQPIESYWLIGKEHIQVKLPPLEKAISLANYDDI